MELINDRACQIYEVPLTGDDHFEWESVPSTSTTKMLMEHYKQLETLKPQPWEAINLCGRKAKFCVSATEKIIEIQGNKWA